MKKQAEGVIFKMLILMISILVHNVSALSVLTFNIWDLFVAKDRSTRMDSILAELKSPSASGAIRHHDIVALQEIWSEDTYNLFKSELLSIYPHSHYFRSGPIGPGLAIFSIHAIIKISLLNFALNGHPGRVFEGDWFATKGVGHLRLSIDKSTTLDVFTTHLIADYANGEENDNNKLAFNDRCEIHRITQLYELLRFAHANTDPNGLGSLILGDLNLDVLSIAWRNLIPGQKLFKSIFVKDGNNQVSCTCNCLDNSYSQGHQRPMVIDHILYTDQTIKHVSHQVAFNGKIPGQTISYSDHFGISAVFDLLPPSPTDNSKLMQGKRVVKKRKRSHYAFFTKSLEKVREMILTEIEKVAEQHSLSKRLAFLLILVTCGIMIGLIVNVRKRFIVFPAWALVSVICLLPILFMVTGFHLVLYYLFYPLEMARLQEFSTQMQYKFI